MIRKRVRMTSEIRGMLGERGDSADWMKAMAAFPNEVPRFDSKADCVKFMTDYNTHHGGSNPENPQLMHIFTMLVSWDQIETLLLPQITRARAEPSSAQRIPPDYVPPPEATNVYERTSEHENGNGNGDGDDDDDDHDEYEVDVGSVLREVEERLDRPIHRCTTPTSTMNTLRYLFFHMKCGIFVMIRNGKLRIFCPFVNKNFRNTWGDVIKLEGDDNLEAYYAKKAGTYRKENVDPDRFKWWANGNIICNELCKPSEKKNMQHWGDHFLAPLRDLLGEACRTREMPDCEFFINKRDYPQLKFNVDRGVPVEPYGFIYDKDDRDPDQDVDLTEKHKFLSYAPIVSFYASQTHRFTDIPWPSSEDWEAACGLVFPNTFMHKKDKEGNAIFDGNPRDLFTEANFRKFERGWDDGRVATAFFRGTATGGGTTIDNNQRLKAAYLCHLWKDDPEKGGEEPFLDAAIVGWNKRDKKIADSPMTFLRDSDFEFTAGKHHFTPIYEQSKYKYLLYVDGHCAACRYGFMMRLGSVILKVESRQVADTMWYFPMLQPYVDHVPIKSDLSDLEEKIRWCREHDDDCKAMGEASKQFWNKYLSQEATVDYVQMVCRQIAKRHQPAPSWWEMAPQAIPPPQLRPPDTPCFEDGKNHSRRNCARCQKAEADEKKAEVERRAALERERVDKRVTKNNARKRMLEKAAKRKAAEAAGKDPKRPKVTAISSTT